MPIETLKQHSDETKAKTVEQLIMLLDTDNQLLQAEKDKVRSQVSDGGADGAIKDLTDLITKEINGGNKKIAAATLLLNQAKNLDVAECCQDAFKGVKGGVDKAQNLARYNGNSDKVAFTALAAGQVLKGTSIVGGIVMAAVMPAAAPIVAIASLSLTGGTTLATAIGWKNKANVDEAFRTRVATGVGGGILGGMTSFVGIAGVAVVSPIIIASTAGVGLLGIAAGLGVTTYKSVIKVNKQVAEAKERIEGHKEGIGKVEGLEDLIKDKFLNDEQLNELKELAEKDDIDGAVAKAKDFVKDARPIKPVEMAGKRGAENRAALEGAIGAAKSRLENAITKEQRGINKMETKKKGEVMVSSGLGIAATGSGAIFAMKTAALLGGFVAVNVATMGLATAGVLVVGAAVITSAMVYKHVKAQAAVKTSEASLKQIQTVENLIDSNVNRMRKDGLKNQQKNELENELEQRQALVDREELGVEQEVKAKSEAEASIEVEIDPETDIDVDTEPEPDILDLSSLQQEHEEKENEFENEGIHRSESPNTVAIDLDEHKGTGLNSH